MRAPMTSPISAVDGPCAGGHWSRQARRRHKHQIAFRKRSGHDESQRASPKLKMIKGSGNVFLDLGFDKAEADSLKMRADLMIQIVDFKKSGMTQARAG